MQGNVNFLFLNLILHMYFWLSIQRISLTFYGYLLHVWYILFIYFCFWLGTLTWTSFPINCLWNCSNLNHNTNVNFHYSIHVWTTLMLLLYLWLSFQRISLTFYGHVLHIWYISPFLARNSCVNVVTQKLFLKLLQNSIKVPMGKLKLYLCRENIDFFKDLKYVNESTNENS